MHVFDICIHLSYTDLDEIKMGKGSVLAAPEEVSPLPSCQKVPTADKLRDHIELCLRWGGVCACGGQGKGAICKYVL